MKHAVVTGSAQGLGLETCRRLLEAGHAVTLTARSAEAVDAGLDALGRPENLDGAVLDVSDDASVDAFFADRTEPVDILVNNAGRIYGAYAATFENVTPADMLDTLDNNAVSAYRMIRAALPGMNERGWGRIVNVSSGLGSLMDGMGPGAVNYRVSKTAMNAVTLIAHNAAHEGVKVNSVCPGWVRTALGGDEAPRDVATGADGIVWAATLPDDGPSGGFFRDGKQIDW